MQVLDKLKSAHASLQDFYHAVKHKQQTSKAIEALQRLSMVNADVPQMDVLQWMSLMAGAGEYCVKPEDKEIHSLFCQVGTRLFTDTVKSPTPLQKHFFWAVVGRWADMVLWSHPIGKQLIREQLEDLLLDYRESGYAVPADYVPGAADY